MNPTKTKTGQAPVKDTADNGSIHPTAVIHPDSHVDPTCSIGPFCIIGSGVELGPGCRLLGHVHLQGPTRIGKNNIFYPFCSIGSRTQDLKYSDEPTYLEIGDENTFRESVTVNRATGAGEKTIIGSHNNFLAYAHVAHNCEVGNHCIFSNNGTLAGHVIMEDYAVIGGLSAVHQFCRNKIIEPGHNNAEFSALGRKFCIDNLWHEIFPSS